MSHSDVGFLHWSCKLTHFICTMHIATKTVIILDKDYFSYSITALQSTI